MAARLAWLGLASITVAIVAAVELRSPEAIAKLEATPSNEPSRNVNAPEAPASSSSSSNPLSALVEALSKPKSAPARELDEARLKGVSALEELAKKYPDDPALLKALAIAQGRNKQSYAAALDTMRHLFTAAPKEAADKDVQQTLLRIANGPVGVATIALEIMEKNMGSEGPDLLYELLIAPGVGKFPKTKATTLLGSKTIKTTANPAVLVAFKLRSQTGCPNAALLKSAAAEGDGRSLALLKAIVTPQKCGFLGMKDCYRCVSSHKAIFETIKAIEKRLNTQAPG